jgi:hypothetical protein
MNLLITLQMAVTYIILICIISTITSRFNYYIPIKEFFNNKGFFYNIQYGINPDTGMTLRCTDELYNLVEGENGIAAQYNVWLDYRDGKDNNDDDNTFMSSDHFISYDDIYAAIYTPELEAGNWFDLECPVQEIVPVVVSQNNYNFKVGEVISLYCFDSEIKAKIIGILKDDTKIIDTSFNSKDNIDYRNLYRNYKFEREEKTAFIMLQKDLLDKDVVMQLDGNVFVTYPSTVSDEVISTGDKQMKQLQVMCTSATEEMKENSLKYIFSQIYDLIPVCICIIILTLVGAISTSALSAKYQLKNYSIYYICGLRWKQCSYVNLFSSLICVIISFVVSIAFTIIASKTAILGNTVIEIGIWQIFGCIILSLLYMFLSLLLPISIIGRNTPNQVLRAN